MATMNMGIYQTRHQRLQLLRKNRWFLSVIGTPSNAFRHTVNNSSQIHIASRPKISFDQRQLNHEIENISYNGRSTWEPMDITFFEAAGDNRIYEWLRKHYDPETGTFGYRNECVVDCQLDMFNGLGDLIERWIVYEAHAASIDWGELDYSNGELAGVTISLAYARAIRLAQEVPAGGPARSSAPSGA